MSSSATFAPQAPYNLALSLDVASRFTPEPEEGVATLRMAVRLDGAAVLMEVGQIQLEPPVLEVAGPATTASKLLPLAAWVVSADLDLRPFYALAAGHPVLGGMVRQLYGVKPLRPASLFEMAVIAVTEQQISLIASQRIRARVVERFGDRIDGLWAFPAPECLAQAAPEELLACGLSHQKAAYIGGLAREVAAGKLDLERLKTMSDDEARAFITQIRGFGRWSADYILVRGLGRPDAVPADDLGLRSIVGRYLGSGERMTAVEVEKALEPFIPYRGLAAFYVLAGWRRGIEPARFT